MRTFLVVLFLVSQLSLYGGSRAEYEQLRLQEIGQEALSNPDLLNDPSPYPELPFSLKKDQVLYSLSYPTFYSLFDPVSRIPHLTIYKLKNSVLVGSPTIGARKLRRFSRGTLSAGKKFKIDLRLPYEAQAFPDDIKVLAGYNRGHLVPHKEAKVSVDLMTNVAPQIEEINSGLWNNIEFITSKLSDTFPSEELFVVTGTVLADAHLFRTDIKMQTPEYFYKIIFIPEDKGCVSAVGFLVPNYRLLWDSLPLKYKTSEASLKKVKLLEKFVGVAFYEDFIEKKSQEVNVDLGNGVTFKIPESLVEKRCPKKAKKKSDFLTVPSSL